MTWCVKTIHNTTCGHTVWQYTDCENPAHERDVGTLGLCHASAPKRWAHRNTHVRDYGIVRPGTYCSTPCQVLYEGWYCTKCPERANANGEPIPGRAVITHPGGVQIQMLFHIGDDSRIHYYDPNLEIPVAGTVL